MTHALNGMAGCGFRELNHRRLFADVVEFNLPSRRVLHKCDFQREGVFRKKIQRDEQLCDQFAHARLSDHPPGH